MKRSVSKCRRDEQEQLESINKHLRGILKRFDDGMMRFEKEMKDVHEFELERIGP